MAGRSGRGANAGAEVEDARPDRVGLHGGGCRSVEDGLEGKLTGVADDPDRSGLGDLPFEAMTLAAVFTGDGHSHCPRRVAPPVLRTMHLTVATRIPPGNKSPTSAGPACRDRPQPWRAAPVCQSRHPASATLDPIAPGTGWCPSSPPPRSFRGSARTVPDPHTIRPAGRRPGATAGLVGRAEGEAWPRPWFPKKRSPWSSSSPRRSMPSEPSPTA